MKKVTVILKDLVKGTITNNDAVPLKVLMDNVISDGGALVISFNEIALISTSFLNSSFGEIIEKYGYEVLKGRVTITNYSSELAAVIKKYVEDFKDTIPVVHGDF